MLLYDCYNSLRVGEINGEKIKGKGYDNYNHLIIKIEENGNGYEGPGRG